jgi:DNA-binding MarR family transcriptional regulator
MAEKVNQVAIARMMAALKLLKDATEQRGPDDPDPERNLHTLQTFLYVAYRHPSAVPYRELEKALGISQTTNSRNIGYWSKGAGKREKGWGMFKVDVDPDYAKRLLVTLTAKGEHLAARISHALAP